MVHMRCQHLHSEFRQTQLLWRALLITRNCQTRQVSKLSTRLKKGKIFESKKAHYNYTNMLK